MQGFKAPEPNVISSTRIKISDMEIKDIRLPMDKPQASENTGVGEQDPKAQKSEKIPVAAAPVLPEAAEPVEPAGVDIVVISEESKAVISQERAPKTATTDNPEEQPQAQGGAEDVNDPKGMTRRHAAIKRDILPDGGRSVLMEDAGDPDVVTISKDLKSVFKSGLLSEAVHNARIDIPGEADSAAFLLAFLNGILPGWNIKVRKVYRRKLGNKKEQGSKEDEKQPDPERSGAETDEGASGPDAKKYECYKPGKVRVAASGIIKAEGKGLRFSLELNMTPSDGADFSGDGFSLGQVMVNYGGDPRECADLGFTFETAEDENDCGKGAPFKGTGVGRLIIDLVPVGRTENGGVIYGLPEG